MSREEEIKAINARIMPLVRDLVLWCRQPGFVQQQNSKHVQKLADTIDALLVRRDRLRSQYQKELAL